MRVAELLSDLTSLRPGLCDTKSALALVSARPDGGSRDSPDNELQRVKDLIELHSKAKSSQGGSIDADLQQARESVAALSR